MDQIRQHTIPTLSQFSQFFLSKKAIQILLSLSVFSFLLPSLFPFLFPSFNYYISTFSMNLFSYSSERNYIFLLCNGILVYLLKNSGLISNPPPADDFKDNRVEKSRRSQRSELSQTEAVVTVVASEFKETERKQNGIFVTVGGDENLMTTTQEEDEDDRFYNIEEEDEGIGLLSAEELKKKCDDFIKNMKAVIKYEAQQLMTV